ncbi:DUF3078 domain-containing protein [bacterium BMS3Abin03]|nr:DUF3078 domain-containing protein [bacterium BMS3Abin03]MCG6961430.1 DUF3078 domain-containing protein [bacterium BMS3Abin03]
MKVIHLFILLLFFSTVTTAKSDEEKKDTLWTPGGVVGLNLSQIAFSNWTQGGDNSLSFTIFSNLKLDYIGMPWKWTNSLKLTYGRSKIGNQGYRTNDNEIYYESVLIHRLGWKVNPYVDATFRTAITKGYNYGSDPAMQIADFFDPAYFTQGLGFAYDEDKGIRQRIGIAFKQTVADKFASLYSDDPETMDEIEKFKFESGLESVTEVEYEFLENMTYDGYLRLFTRFNELDKWDVRWDNIITAKVNDYVNVNFNFLLIYEKDQSLKRQIKEALQLGFTYSLF